MSENDRDIHKRLFEAGRSDGMSGIEAVEGIL